MLRIVLTGFGILLLVLATVLASLRGWLATKGLTSKGLILDPRAQGRVLPVSVGGLIRSCARTCDFWRHKLDTQQETTSKN